MCVCATGAQFSSSPHATSSPHARPGYALPQQQQQQQQSSLGASIGLRQPGFQQQGFQHPQGLQQGYQQPQGFQQGFQQPQGFGGQFGQAQSYGQPSFQVIRSSLTHMCQACCMHVLSCSRLACASPVMPASTGSRPANRGAAAFACRSYQGALCSHAVAGAACCMPTDICRAVPRQTSVRAALPS